jgi:SAM-dependent methyltransferase
VTKADGRGAAGADSPPASAFYDDIADVYDIQMSRMPGDIWARDAFQAFVTRDLAPRDVLLDFGCGTGIDARAYAAKGFRVIGYDSSPGMARVAANRGRAADAGGRVEIFSGPYEEFLRGPWAKERPAAIVSNFAVLNLVPSLREAFARFHEILGPGGSVFLSLLNPCYVRNAVTPGLRRAMLQAILHGVSEFPSAKVPTLFYRESFVRREARPYFRLDRRAGIGAIVNGEAIEGSWQAPLGLRERVERRFFATRAMAGAGKFTFLKLRRHTG